MTGRNEGILRSLVLAALLLVAGSGMACNASNESAEQATPSETEAGSQTATEGSSAAPEEALPEGHILVQHVLIGYQGSVPGKNITRSQAEAEKLANDILQRARNGEDFGELVQQYTDDQYPGVYGMADNGVTPGANEFPRNGMVKGFGDAAFSLQVGEVGMASYDAKASPYGWHVIKRLQ